MSDISLVTVTFHKDFKLLERQLISINNFVTSKHKHLIILNDEEKYLDDLINITSKFNCEVFLYKDLPLDHQVINLGWNNQQILKLLACYKVTTSFYLNLDSKDYFIDKINLDSLIVDNAVSLKISKIDLPNNSPQFNTYFKNSFKCFDLDCELYRTCTTDSRTPFMFDTQHVKNLILHLDLNYMKINILVTNEQSMYSGQCTEFYLYVAYCEKNKIKINWVNELLANELRYSIEGRLE